MSRSEHQYTLYSVTRLAAYYLQRHHCSDRHQEDVVNDFTRKFAGAIQDSLVVAPFDAAAAKETTTPAKRLLVRLAARTAVDAAVAHAATEANRLTQR